MCVYMFVELNK